VVGRRSHRPAAGSAQRVRRLAHWLVYALGLTLAVIAVDLRGLLAQTAANEALARGDVGPYAELASPRGQLARAYRLHRDGRLEEALAAYGAISASAAPEVRAVQRFNLANLYLERAVDHERAEEERLAITLIELAKQHYREILARDEGHWGARYNLSRALQMLPDLASVEFDDDVMPERSPRAPQAARAYDRLP
jgi:mxaK protein